MNIKKISAILLIMLMFLTTVVSAYSTKTYSIEIPGEGFEVVEDNDIVMFQKSNGDNILVQEVKQNVLGGKLTQYQLNSISKEIVEQYQKQYKATVEEVKREEVTINDLKITKMLFKTQVGESVIYQEMNIFIAGDKIFDVIFTSVTKTGFSEDTKNTVLKSFKVLENATTEPIQETENTSDTTFDTIFKVVLFSLATLILVSLIVQLYRKPKTEIMSEYNEEKSEDK